MAGLELWLKDHTIQWDKRTHTAPASGLRLTEPAIASQQHELHELEHQKKSYYRTDDPMKVN